MQPVDPRSIEWPQRNQAITTLQIIVMSLASGIGVFAVVGLAMNGFAMTWRTDLMTVLALGMLIVNSGLSFVIPGLFQPTSVDHSSDATVSQRAQALFAQLQTQTIIACALVEGAAFFCLVVYLQDQSLLALAGGVLAGAILATRFPTHMGVLHWIADRLE